MEAEKNQNYFQLQSITKRIASYIEKNLSIYPGECVAIKLNLVGAFPPERAITTNPEIIRMLIEILISYGCTIMLCEDIEDEKALNICGISSLLQQYNMKFYNLREYGYEKVCVDGREYMFSSLILKCDHFINLPKLKTHLLTNYTGAIKNIYGCIAKEQRKKLHKYLDEIEFSKILYCISQIRPADIVIMDAIYVMEGMGPTLGTPKYLGYVLWGNNNEEIDYFATQLLGYKPEELPMFEIVLDDDNRMSKIDISKYLTTDVKVSILPVYRKKERQRFMNLLKRTYSVEQKKCISCGRCRDNCPFNAISIVGGYPKFDHKKCRLCTCCIELCPTNAINQKRRKYE